MIIGGLQKFTLIDYPGKLAATVFLTGCNFKCPFCYAKELVLPAEIKKQPKITSKYFFNFLKERRKLLEGVTICGGEPCFNKNLPQFCQKIKKLGYFVKIDTNGSNPKMLEKLIRDKLIDYVAMDVKAPQEKYEKATGVKFDIKKIQKSIDILKAEKVDYEFRSTILPKIHTKEDIMNIAKWVKDARVYYLQQFRPEKTIDPAYEKCKPFSQDELELIQKVCNLYVITKIRI